MRRFGAAGLVLSLVGGALLTGCSGMAITGKTDVDKSSFGAKKHFAVVSVSSVKAFAGEKGLTQLFKNTDDIPGANTQPIIDALEPKILSSLGRTKHFTLVPQRTVLNSRAYRNIKEDERVTKVLFMSNEMNVASHYKFISEPEKLAKLAKELNVDGVIAVTMSFSIASAKGGVSVNGLSLGKKSYSSIATISALAYDKTGRVIWKDSTVKEADAGDAKAIVLLDATDMTSTDFVKMRPSAIEIGRKAVDVLVARFDDTMAGKEVSSMQSMR